MCIARKILLLLATAGLIRLTPFAQAASCPQEFQATRAPYVLSADDLQKIESICTSGHLGLLHPTSPTIPAELLLYAVYHCDPRHLEQVTGKVYRSLLSSREEGSTAEGAQLWNIMKSAKPTFEGVGPELKAQWKEAALKQLGERMARIRSPSINETGRKNLIFSLKKAQPFLSEEELKDAIREIASSSAHGLANDMVGVTEPKLFQFAKAATRRDLGLEYEPLTDLVVFRSGDYLRSAILSVDAPAVVPRSTVWKDGLARSQIEATALPRGGREDAMIMNSAVRWELNGRNYEGTIKVNLGKPLNESALAMESLDHEALWSDGKLTGMIFPGANMGNGEGGAHEVMNEYLAYYRKKGFKFSPPAKTSDFRSFLGEEIKSGRLDYLFKEEHAGGQDKYFSGIATEGAIRTGTRKAAGGKEEVVHIFFPEESKIENEIGEELSRVDVGAWVNERSAKGGKQLFYVDTACHGLGAACQLTNVAGDKNLVVAGSNEQLDTFTNDPASPVYHLLEGVRGKKDFPWMEQAMRENNSEGEQLYLLPHSNDWKRTIQADNQRALKIEINVTENGKPVTVETVGR